jgi:predicted dehydrogenase/threonine dehydrogenase-like Zn-dependent dehydrogenase
VQQVVQQVRSGETEVYEIPAPVVGPREVLVDTRTSVISAGTERYVVELAKKSLFGKARSRPADVRRVLQKMKSEGIANTLQQVKAKLDEPLGLGYSAAGVVIACGAAVRDFRPGDRVAAAGPHAGVFALGHNLCAHVPSGVTFEQAAYTSIASIALQGVRLAHATVGDTVLVIGLGLLGQICVSILKAQGCRVFGTDLNEARLTLAADMGADAVATGSPLSEIERFSRGHGVDAVIITAATASNEPIEFAAEACRAKGRIVLVGVTGLELPRAPFFKKELEFTVSSSLGPGRGDPLYEDKGVDYPIGYARWTAQRNMTAVLDLMAAGKLPVERLTTHWFAIDRATEAYDLVMSRAESYLGIVLDYPATEYPAVRRCELIRRHTTAKRDNLRVSVVGAGNFARLVMLPALRQQGGIHWRGICTAKGLTAVQSGRGTGFEYATTELDEICADEQTDVVFITTRHNLHASMVIACLRAGKHVFVEKPMCISGEQLDEISECVTSLGPGGPILTVGFNRRFTAAAEHVRRFMDKCEPMTIGYRFAPGAIPAEHWTQDSDTGGGRIIGEACHAIDTCVALAGALPVRVYAESLSMESGGDITDDKVLIIMKHENGCVSNVSYQAGGDKAFPSERIEVFGGGRTAVVDNWNRVELWSGGNCRRTSGAKDKGHSSEFARFLAVCREGGAWPISWQELHAVSWAAMAAVESLRCGYPVEYGQPLVSV